MLKHLLYNWIATRAKSQMRQSVADAVRTEWEKQSAAPEETDPQVDVAIFFALGIEAGGLVDRFERVTTTRTSWGVVRRGIWKKVRVALIETGSGARRATEAAQAAIDSLGPRWVVSSGFAGGLDPVLKKQDLVLAEAVLGTDGTREDLGLQVQAKSFPADLHVGPILSVDQVVREPKTKRKLGHQYGALAVDLETLAVARVCQDRQIPFLAVRGITDTVDEALSADVARLGEVDNPARQIGAALGAIWRRPSSVKEMWALKETALMTSERLGQFLTEIVEILGQATLENQSDADTDADADIDGD